MRVTKEERALLSRIVEQELRQVCLSKGTVAHPAASKSQQKRCEITPSGDGRTPGRRKEGIPEIGLDAFPFP